MLPEVPLGHIAYPASSLTRSVRHTAFDRRTGLTAVSSPRAYVTPSPCRLLMPPASLHLARQVRHHAQHPLHQHELRAVMHLVFLRAQRPLEPCLIRPSLPASARARRESRRIGSPAKWPRAPPPHAAARRSAICRAASAPRPVSASSGSENRILPECSRRSIAWICSGIF